MGDDSHGMDFSLRVGNCADAGLFIPAGKGENEHALHRRGKLGMENEEKCGKSAAGPADCAAESGGMAFFKKQTEGKSSDKDKKTIRSVPVWRNISPDF